MIDPDVRIGAANAYSRLWGRVFRPHILIVGDSISRAGHPWSYRLRTNPLGIQNIARDGYNTELIKLIVEQALAKRPEVILYMSGTNDVLHGHDKFGGFEAAYRTNISLAKTAPRLIVTLAPPTRSADWNLRLVALNSTAKKIAVEAGATVIDLWPKMVDADGLLHSHMTTDGIHFTGEGYAVWSEELRAALAKQ
ncbi:GDSL-type esterase/lipase family protein [Bosea sp. AAP35]|uniref:SGNH/GDSL hydrolase family protein n=1 Tax=Bosea sp. AAP35 TaxID=1523417 RepID=UPI001AEBE8BD|nr:GDSL-type esterase/lipase family protein [Bosea sp. AAP35]